MNAENNIKPTEQIQASANNAQRTADVNQATQYANIDDWECTLMLTRLGLKYQEYDIQQSENAMKQKYEGS